jgi:tetratricopeptide (TPR) repeat protein
MHIPQTPLSLKIKWDILDFILIQLGVEGDNICNKQPITKNEFYTAHINLICKDDITHFKQTVTQITKPFYPYIIFTYYILFHRKNLKTAYELYQMILESYRRNLREFNEDELSAFEMLKDIVKRFKALNKLGKEQEGDNLPSHLMLLALNLKSIQCSEWSCLFKDLLLSWISINNEKLLENIKKATERIPDILDKEIIEHYNIVDVGQEESSIYTFFFHISRKLMEKKKKIKKQINELQKQKEKYKNRLNMLKKIEDKGRIIEVHGFNIINILLSPLFYYYKLKIKNIDKNIKNIKNLRFKHLEKIIWY